MLQKALLLMDVVILVIIALTVAKTYNYLGCCLEGIGFGSISYITLISTATMSIVKVLGMPGRINEYVWTLFKFDI